MQVPVARNRDGSTVTGLVFGRIVNRSGPGAQPLIVQTNPVPYLPASLDTTQGDAGLARSRNDGRRGHRRNVHCERRLEVLRRRHVRRAATPLTTLPVQICLKGGFNPAKLYQVVYTAKDPYVLGVGFAAWRDVGSFFKYAAQGRCRHAEPARRPHHVEHRARRLAIGQLPARLAAPRLQSGRSEPPGARRHVADHRGPPHRAQLPLGAARRRARALPGGQRRSAVVGASIEDQRARPADAQHSRPLQRTRKPARRSSSTSARPKSGR